MPVVALLGSRQVGKTALALEVAKIINQKSAYLDLKIDTDLAKLTDAEANLSRFENKLLIIDEVQRQPDIFRLLRGLVDIRKRAGEKAGIFYCLALPQKFSFSIHLKAWQVRIRYIELSPFTALETYQVYSFTTLYLILKNKGQQ